MSKGNFNQKNPNQNNSGGVNKKGGGEPPKLVKNHQKVVETKVASYQLQFEFKS